MQQIVLRNKKFSWKKNGFLQITDSITWKYSRVNASAARDSSTTLSLDTALFDNKSNALNESCRINVVGNIIDSPGWSYETTHMITIKIIVKHLTKILENILSPIKLQSNIRLNEWQQIKCQVYLQDLMKTNLDVAHTNIYCAKWSNWFLHIE